MNPFLDPNDTATAVVDRLLEDQNLFNAERKRNAEEGFFLNSLKAWKDTAAQGQGKPGFVLTPPPSPPAGYKFVDVPPIDTAPPVLSARVVGERNDNGTYSDHGKQLDPAGTVIDNPHLPGGYKLVKVIRKTPFGSAHYWIDSVAGKGNK